MVKTRKSFTLLELIIVIVIIGILASLGLPQFFKTRERALGDEAIANLKLIAAAEKIYQMETGSYYISSDLNNINSNLKLSLTDANWAYSITGGLAAFTAIAARNGDGGYFDCVYSFTNTDTDGEPNPGTSCP